MLFEALKGLSCTCCWCFVSFSVVARLARLKSGSGLIGRFVT